MYVRQEDFPQVALSVTTVTHLLELSAPPLSAVESVEKMQEKLHGRRVSLQIGLLCRRFVSAKPTFDLETCRLSIFCFRSPNDEVYFALSDGHFRRGVQEVDREGGDLRVSRALLVKLQLSIEALCILFKARRWARIKKRKTQHRTSHSLHLCHRNIVVHIINDTP